MRTLLLTADARRHRYAAGALATSTELVGVVVERKRNLGPAEPLRAADRLVLERHFAERDEVETRLLGEPGPMPADALEVARGEVNSAAVAEWIRARGPDVIVLFGCGLVRDPLLLEWQGRLVNVHLGLSPYYRGAATNFWPLVLDQPECVGATIHLAARDVDAGDILAQVRPAPASGDRGHELGTKAIIAAFEELPRVLQGLANGVVTPRRQDLAVGRVFRGRDFNADAVRRLWHNLAGGMIPAYCTEFESRQARFPIVEVSA